MMEEKAAGEPSENEWADSLFNRRATRKIHTTVRIPRWLLEKAEQIAEEKDSNRSEVIRDGLKQVVEK